MSDFIDLRIAPTLWFLADWSLHWGVLIVLLWAAFALRPPHQASLRLVACQLVLVAGLLLPLVPRWWGPERLPVGWNAGVRDIAFDSTSTNASIRLPHVAPTEPTVARNTAPLPLLGAANQRPEAPVTEVTSSTPVATANPLGFMRVALLMVGALWCLITCLQVSRLIVGMIRLSRLARTASPPNSHAQELFDQCRAEGGLRRLVRLGIHPTISAPVFVGGRRPSVVVPTDWERLEPQAQRAVLWHELTHAARRDDVAKLIEELIRAAFFFHPLVHWLLNRIDAYREQVCDAAAVRHGVAGRMLAQILVDFSRRKAVSQEHDSALRPALPFFRRRTVKSRIRALLDENAVVRWSAPLLRRQFGGLALTAIAMPIAVGGFGAHAARSLPTSFQSPPLPTELPTLDPPAILPQSHTSKPSAEKSPPGTPKTATANTLERILANWKTRQSRTKSLYFSWKSQQFFGESAHSKQPNARNRACQISFWAAEPDRFRFDLVPLTTPQTPAPPFASKLHSVINGTTLLSVEDPGNAVGSPVATISTWPELWQRIGSPLHFWTLNCLTLATRPLDAFVRRQGSQFRVVAENALVDGVRCVELQSPDENKTWVERCWVDPSRDDVIVAYELEFRSRLRRGQKDAITISIQYQRDRTHGWVPTGWTFKRLRELSESTVTQFTINERFPDEIFSLNLAPGTSVFDERRIEQYLVAQDGSRSHVVTPDSLPSLKVQRALEARSDFQIQPQSMKDAIDFIAAHYRIPIILNRREFDAAGIDITSEVQFAEVGVAVEKVLQSVLTQAQKPAGFRIEDEVLKISPRFVGHEPNRVKASPPLPKTASAKERKIQDALELQVDFQIEPQSLKDALDWLAARYQIPIESDPLMDSMVEVKGNCPGVKLRSLLNILLEECPGELAFKIERDALRIYSRTAKR